MLRLAGGDYLRVHGGQGNRAIHGFALDDWVDAITPKAFALFVFAFDEAGARAGLLDLLTWAGRESGGRSENDECGKRQNFTDKLGSPCVEF